MLYDYALWKGDKKFIKSLMPKAREMIELFFIDRCDSTGLIKTPKGWNFFDWADNTHNLLYKDENKWSYGMPLDNGTGISCIFNIHMILTLNQIIELEDFLEEPELTARSRRLASGLMTKIINRFWDEKKGMLADDLNHRHYSEHAQCMAVLSGRLDRGMQDRVINALQTEQNIARASAYFSNYIFEALRAAGHIEHLLVRLEPWFLMNGLGFKTTPEIFSETVRSDCHAWSAHPIYHFLTTVLGIRPGSMGFDTVEIRPQPGMLNMVKGSMVHPKGEIKVDLLKENSYTRIKIMLPEGLYGKLIYMDYETSLSPGEKEFILR